MKKLSAIIAVLALTTGYQTVRAQQTQTSGGVNIDLEGIARAEYNPSVPLDGGKLKHGFGNSSVYTNFSASFGEHWAISWVSHWADTGGDTRPFGATKDLYTNTLRCTNSWLDYLYADYSTGGWTFRLGKDCEAIGGFEYDDWDWTVDRDLASQYWNNNCSYRWGGSIFWTTADKVSTLQLQAISSPDHGLDDYTWRPWHKGYGMYTLKHLCSLEDITTSCSAAWAQYGPNMGKATAVLGMSGAVNDRFTLRGEVAGRFGTGTAAGRYSLKSLLEALWSPSDKWDLRMKVCYERIGLAMELSGWLEEDSAKVSAVNTLALGCTAAFYPLRNSRDLRLHATIAYNDYAILAQYSHKSNLLMTVGVIYDHVFKLK